MPQEVPPLFPHQIPSISLFANIPRGFDASDPGTGKTRVQIEAFVGRSQFTGKSALVIAPKSLLRSAWEADFKKYAPGVSVSVAYADNRSDAFNRAAQVYVTNTDAVRWLAKQTPSFFDRFDTLIVDEISYFKHHTSARSKALNKIKKYFKYRYGLTGTPSANHITDIWNQIYILDDGQRLGQSFFKFRGQTCSPQQVGRLPHMLKWEPKPGVEGVIASLIADITTRNEFEKCLGIPANHSYAVEFLLPPKLRAYYDTMERDALLQIKNTTISAVNAAVILGKLQQIASGAVYDTLGGQVHLDGSRAELVGDLVDARKQCVVFFQWEHQRDDIIKAFGQRGISYRLLDGSVPHKERDIAVDLFQAGHVRVILAHPASAAHGLTLTKGTSTIWASPTYNLEHFIQGNKRIYRAGQTLRTETVVLLAEGTVEHRIYARLLSKNATQTTLLDILAP